MNIDDVIISLKTQPVEYKQIVLSSKVDLTELSDRIEWILAADSDLGSLSSSQCVFFQMVVDWLKDEKLSPTGTSK